MPRMNLILSWLGIYLALFCSAGPASAHFRTYDFISTSVPDLVTERSLPSKIQAITILTGVPLTGGGDIEGGFGDVATNVVAALEFKHRFPDVEVNLIVNSVKVRRKGVYMSETIVQKMLPGFNPKIRNRVQNVSGLQVFFPHFDYTEVVYRNLEPYDFGALKKADLLLQFSTSARRYFGGLNFLAPVRLSFNEYNAFLADSYLYESDYPEDKGFLSRNQVLSHGFSYRGVSGLSELSSSGWRSGAHGEWGVAISRKQDRDYWSWDKMEAYFLSSQADWQKGDLANSQTVLIYPKRDIYGLQYFKIIAKWAAEHPDQRLSVIMKEWDSPEIQIEKWIHPNLRVHMVSHLPYDLLESLVYRSHLPPLIAGDTLLGVALSALNTGRLFFHEVLPWKYGLESRLKRLWQQSAEGILGYDQYVNWHLGLLQLNFQGMAEPITEETEDFLYREWKKMMRQPNEQKLLAYGAFERLQHQDIYSNVVLFYDFVQRYELLIKNDFLHYTGYTLNHLLSLLFKSGDWNIFLEELKGELERDFILNRVELSTYALYWLLSHDEVLGKSLERRYSPWLRSRKNAKLVPDSKWQKWKELRELIRKKPSRALELCRAKLRDQL